MKITINKELGCWEKREEVLHSNTHVKDWEIKQLNDFFGNSLSEKCWTLISYEVVPENNTVTRGTRGYISSICSGRCKHYSVSVKLMTVWEKMRFLWLEKIKRIMEEK